MPSFTLETEAGGLSTQVGDPLPSLEAAVENAIQRANLNRSLVGTVPPFRLVRVDQTISEAETAQFATLMADAGLAVF